VSGTFASDAFDEADHAKIFWKTCQKESQIRYSRKKGKDQLREHLTGENGFLPRRGERQKWALNQNGFGGGGRKTKAFEERR